MPEKTTVPHDKGLDHTVGLAREGYLFIPHRMEKLKTDIFVTHVMAKRTICITGLDAVELFYDPNKITRKNAAPGYVKKTLFGEHTVHGMEGEEHRQRRALFLEVLTEPAKKELSQIYKEYLDKSLPSWEFHEPVVLYNEIKKSLTASVCQWAGIPILEEELKDKADQLMAMVFAFGNVIGIHEEGKAARKVLEEWMEKVMNDVRSGFIDVPENSPIVKVCEFKEDGKLLEPHMAAVEMLNVLRPLVATSIYVAFAALALHEYPAYREELILNGDDYLYMFCEEVRRFYPLAPFLGGLVAQDFEWKGCEFKKDDMVLLDVYGTNHSPKVWKNPNQFDPTNFQKLQQGSDAMISQGSGDMERSHRCPGEDMVRQLLMDSVEFLGKKITYEVIPEQTLDYDLTKIPTMPFSGIEVRNLCRRVES